MSAFTRSHGSSISPVIVAFATGVYVATFYVVGNITMLPAISMLYVFLGLTVPLVITVIASNKTLHAYKRESWIPAISTFISASYLLIMLRTPIFEAPAVAAFGANLGGILWVLVQIFVLGVAATIITLVFRNNQPKLIIVLAAMNVAAIALSYNTITLSIFGAPDNSKTELQALLQDVTFAYQPNVYFILADGYSSFAYLDSNEINVAPFKQYLRDNEFRIYHDTFSNYQPTIASMLSMLNMDHHYYNYPIVKSSEVFPIARKIVGGDNSLVRLLKHHGYNTQYIHQGNYLLLQGCSADYCFPKPDTFGLGIFTEVLPRFLVGTQPGPWFGQSLETVKEKVVNRLELHKDLSAPLFQYIHLFEPGHAANDVYGACSEKEQLQIYSRKITEIDRYLRSLIDIILEFDSSAVIAISGDHGPSILNNCVRYGVDLTTANEYRDRAGSLMTVRWPRYYDGRYDEHIKTNINLFCYILASMAQEEASVIDACVSDDDVYVAGDGEFLKVMSDGVISIPPVRYSVDDMQEIYADDFGRR